MIDAIAPQLHHSAMPRIEAWSEGDLSGRRSKAVSLAVISAGESCPSRPATPTKVDLTSSHRDIFRFSGFVQVDTPVVTETRSLGAVEIQRDE